MATLGKSVPRRGRSSQDFCPSSSRIVVFSRFRSAKRRFWIGNSSFIKVCSLIQQIKGRILRTPPFIYAKKSIRPLYTEYYILYTHVFISTKTSQNEFLILIRQASRDLFGRSPSWVTVRKGTPRARENLAPILIFFPDQFVQFLPRNFYLRLKRGLFESRTLPTIHPVLF